jgi:hypothetical protein
MMNATDNDVLTLEQIREAAPKLAADLRAHDADGGDRASGGSKHRQLPEELRTRFIRLRTSLFQRGVYDPVLVRFDTATAGQAKNGEIADQLDALATSLTV